MFTRIAPLLFVLLWSSSFIAAKAGLRHLSPLLFVAIRLVGCAAVLLALMLLLRRSWQPLGGLRWLHCAIAGALVNAIGLMAPHVGLLMAPAAQIALVQSLTPLLTAALGVVLLHERLLTSQWLGLALGLAILYMLAAFDPSLYTERDVEVCMQLPVLALVPNVAPAGKVLSHKNGDQLRLAGTRA